MWLCFLQVLAASKNKISTLKGFPHLPSLEVGIDIFIQFLDPVETMFDPFTPTYMVWCKKLIYFIEDLLHVLLRWLIVVEIGSFESYKLVSFSNC